MDADGQLPAETLPKFIKAIEDGASLAIGNRIIKPRVCEKIFTFFASRLSSIRDPYCGMKAYCLKALNQKGYIKMKNFKKNPNKLNYAYILTPKGISAKIKLTVRFMKRMSKEYDELKKELSKN